MYGAIRNHYTLSAARGPHWTRWNPHQWLKKPADGRFTFVAWDGAHVAGFINLRYPFSSHSNGQPASVYIEHLGTCPGNMNTTVWSGRLSHVGVCLVAFAVQFSVNNGCGGRLCLHAVEESESFWLELGSRFEINQLYDVDTTGIDGFHQNNSNLRYLEMSELSAKKILEAYLP